MVVTDQVPTPNLLYKRSCNTTEGLLLKRQAHTKRVDTRSMLAASVQAVSDGICLRHTGSNRFRGRIKL